MRSTVATAEKDAQPALGRDADADSAQHALEGGDASAVEAAGRGRVSVALMEMLKRQAEGYFQHALDGSNCGWTCSACAQHLTMLVSRRKQRSRLRGLLTDIEQANRKYPSLTEAEMRGVWKQGARRS